MRIRPVVAWFVAIAVVLVVLAIWLGGKRPEPALVSPEQTNPPPASVPEDAAVQSSKPSQPAGPSVQASVPSTNAVISTNGTSPFPGSQAEQRLNILSNYNDVAIVFYGRLEDQ